MKSKIIMTLTILPCAAGLSLPVSAETAVPVVKQVSSLTKREQTEASALNFLARLALTKAEYKKAINDYKRILEIYKEDPGIGPKSAKCALMMSRIAMCQKHLERKTEATKTAREALDLIEGQTPENNPEEGNFILMTKENCKSVLGKEMPPPAPPKTPPLQLKSIPLSEIASLSKSEARIQAIMRSRKNKASIQYMSDKLYLANIYTLEKKYTLAKPLFAQVISQAEKKYGKNGPQLLQILSNYGYMLLQNGNTLEAQSVLSRMQQIRTTAENEMLSKPSTKIKAVKAKSTK